MEGAERDVICPGNEAGWLVQDRDGSLEDSANLPDPHVLAAEIEDVLGDLEARVGGGDVSAETS